MHYYDYIRLKQKEQEKTFSFFIMVKLLISVQMLFFYAML